MDSKSLIIIIETIIIIIGSIWVWYEIRKSKQVESFSVILFTTGLSLVTSSSSSFFDKVLMAFGVAMNYSNPVALGGDFNKYYFALGVLLIGISIYIRCYVKKKLYILNINSYFHRSIEEYMNSKNLKVFDFRQREIDFVNVYKKIFKERLDDESFSCIKSEIEDKVKAFKNEAKAFRRGYTGIASIPFVIYAGTFLERTSIDDFYEFDKVTTQDYYKLSDKSKNNYPELKVITDINSLNNSESDAIVAISVTGKISDEDISQFTTDNIIRIEVDNPKDNTITEVAQLDKYTNVIMTLIEELGKKIPSLNTIHLLYSGQSCMALELGKRCIDSTRLPEIISYQYERQSEKKYPWGIVVNGMNKGKLIKC
ncbi:MAG: SAVED domain-containing protein [Clostridium sp.]|uniref:SAVED domain-containing protein n=1 Tax=Clostridium sp. TaxID=1506 RepID=UPI0029054DD8|nr:SAVED domain-containing protein [Clostridium sp.]MDU2895244.1 SAVED domain-containing protein [Clostridium sp.]MDU3007045.1 SAVED domain-containing protein [Clostridium sp.]MDU3036965.1 SAVED domain-containing protein [Clostridium sp.]MDU3051288.1 SAVED domain-containing protein [Clostridium sp.]